MSENNLLNGWDRVYDTLHKIETNKIKNAKLCYYEEVPDKYKGMLYWEDYQHNNGFFYDLNDLYEYCEDASEEVPDYVWGTQTDMIHIDADSIVEQACEELHEDAYDSISYSDIKELQKMLDDWCNEQTGTVTYYPDYTYAIKVCRDDG